MEPVVSHGVFLVSHIQGCGSILICMDPDPTFHVTDRLYPWFRNTVFYGNLEHLLSFLSIWNEIRIQLRIRIHEAK